VSGLVGITKNGDVSGVDVARLSACVEKVSIAANCDPHSEQ